MKKNIVFYFGILFFLLLVSCPPTVTEKTGDSEGLHIDRTAYTEAKRNWETTKPTKYEFTYCLSYNVSPSLEARVFVDGENKEIIIRQRNGFTKDEYLRDGHTEEEWNNLNNVDSDFHKYFNFDCYFKSIDDVFTFIGQILDEYENAIKNKDLYSARCDAKYGVWSIPEQVHFRIQHESYNENVNVKSFDHIQDYDIKFYISNFDTP